MKLNEIEVPDGWELVEDEYYSPDTVSLDELVACGVVDFGAEDMRYDAPSEEVRAELNRKILARYGMRDISIIPPGRWKQQFVRKLDEIMPKYSLWFEKLDNFNIFQESDVYGKSRDVFSDFPQTQLSGRGDYASTGNDREHEDIAEGSPLAKIEQLRNYDDVYVAMLDDLEILFSPFMALNVNGW